MTRQAQNQVRFDSENPLFSNSASPAVIAVGKRKWEVYRKSLETLSFGLPEEGELREGGWGKGGDKETEPGAGGGRDVRRSFCGWNST